MSAVTPIDAIQTPPELAAPPRRKGTLLIVDDEDGPRQSLRVIFKDDYDILIASNGPAAIELAQNNRIDVAVLDIRMSGMSGMSNSSSSGSNGGTMGNSSDRQLMMAEVAMHRHMLHELTMLQPQATGAARQLVDQTIPVVRQHLTDAQGVWRQVGGGNSR